MGKYPYGVTSAISYATILLLTLWWLPVLGPMITGYITGRKAGGPIKGIIAMAVPIFLYFLLIYAIHQNWVHLPSTLSGFMQNLRIGDNLILPIVSALPFVSYADTTLKMAMDVGLHIQNYLYYAPPSFFIMLSFAFIGGAVSRMVILERGIYRERVRVPRIRKREIREEPESIQARVLLPTPVTSMETQPKRGVRPFVMPGEESVGNEEKKRKKNLGIPMLGDDEEEKKESEKVKLEGVEKKRKNSRTKKKRGVRKFSTEEESPFVVHPLDKPEPVGAGKKKISTPHSLTYL